MQVSKNPPSHTCTTVYMVPYSAGNRIKSESTGTVYFDPNYGAHFYAFMSSNCGMISKGRIRYTPSKFRTNNVRLDSKNCTTPAKFNQAFLEVTKTKFGYPDLEIQRGKLNIRIPAAGSWGQIPWRNAEK